MFQLLQALVEEVVLLLLVHQTLVALSLLDEKYPMAVLVLVLAVLD